MKSKIALVTLAVAVLLSACSTSNLTVMKRKYNNGYYVSFGNKNKNTVSTPSNTKEASVDSKTTTKVLSIATESSVQDAVVKETADAGKQKDAVSETSSDNSTNASTEVKNPRILNPAVPVLKDHSKDKPLTIKERLANKIIGKKINNAQNNNAEVDGNTILLIILCFFPILALIAIYIHDGGITMNFWIDLLLHFIFLYWLFALLVVLDVINLG